MVCPKCGSPVSPDDTTCSNCGSELKKSARSLDVKSEGLKRMTQELKAVNASPQIFPAGETIADRFEIEEMVERGPFGEVYKAWDDLVETEVALKVFDEDVVRDPVEREDFLSATHAARAMTQKNVVRLHDSGVHRDHPWVSMQYLEGLTLRKALELREKKDERFTLEELEPVITQITLALQHIGREFPNGNLKPTNIFFLPDLLKVTDGYILAALPGDLFVERLSDSRYLAPELHTATEDADSRCDVYSLGVIIGEMLFGPNYQAGSDVISDPEESAIDALCRRATAFDPAERYPSVEALSEDFSTLVDTGQLLDRGPMLSSGAGAAAGGIGEESSVGEDVPVEFEEIPEEDIATREYGRGPEGEPAGPDEPTAVTDAMPLREDATSELPDEEADVISEEPSGPGAGGPPAPPPGEPAEDDEQEPSESDDAAAAPTPSAKKPADRSSSGPAPHIVIGGFVGVLLVVLVVVALFMPDGEDEAIDIEGQAEQTATDEEESGDEEATADKDEKKEEEEDEGPSVETIEAAVTQAATATGGALGDAREKADEEGEALAKKEEEEKAKEKENADEQGGSKSAAVASAGEQQGSSSGSRSGSGSNSSGAAKATGGGKKDVKKPEPARGTNCPEGMGLVKSDSGNYCIDKFEYPGRGRTPRTNVTWFGAQKKCRQQGKRLCKMNEWRRACGSKYPWGSKWDPDRCNTQDADGFARSLAAAGKFRRCRSWSGAYDMVGNAAEWVKEQKIVGGGFGSGPDVATCRYSSKKSPGTGSPNVGFRCCDTPK